MSDPRPLLSTSLDGLITRTGTYMKCPVAPGPVRSRQYDDTTSNDKQDDPRGAIALARMNWLHSKYSIVSSRPPIHISYPNLIVLFSEQ